MYLNRQLLECLYSIAFSVLCNRVYHNGYIFYRTYIFLNVTFYINTNTFKECELEGIHNTCDLQILLSHKEFPDGNEEILLNHQMNNFDCIPLRYSNFNGYTSFICHLAQLLLFFL